MTTPQEKPELAIVEKPNVLPMLSPAIAAQRASVASEIIRLMLKNEVLQKGRHFGEIPGTNDKMVLLKPGAELLNKAFGYAPMFSSVTVIEDWDKKLFFYRIECRLVDTATGITIASGIGSCNSYESKYRYRWLYDNQLTEMGLTKDSPGVVARTRKSKKGGSYTQYRIENDDVFSLVNTIDKMAQKRALIAASLIGTGASEFFTQDIEDIPQFGGLDVDDGVVDAEPPVVIESDPMDYIRLGIRTGIGDEAMVDAEMCKLLDVAELTKEAIKYKYGGKTGREVVQIALDAFEATQAKYQPSVPEAPAENPENGEPEASPEAAKSQPVSSSAPVSVSTDDAPATDAPAVATIEFVSERIKYVGPNNNAHLKFWDSNHSARRYGRDLLRDLGPAYQELADALKVGPDSQDAIELPQPVRVWAEEKTTGAGIRYWNVTRLAVEGGDK